jgi:hypothetical protein
MYASVCRSYGGHRAGALAACYRGPLLPPVGWGVWIRRPQFFRRPDWSWGGYGSEPTEATFTVGLIVDRTDRVIDQLEALLQPVT